jgi:hypothetical protein
LYFLNHHFIIMASLYEFGELLVKGDYILPFDNLLEVVRDASIKYKFSFKILYKNPKHARYKCINRVCPWKTNAHLNLENKNEII